MSPHPPTAASPKPLVAGKRRTTHRARGGLLEAVRVDCRRRSVDNLQHNRCVLLRRINVVNQATRSRVRKSACASQQQPPTLALPTSGYAIGVEGKPEAASTGRMGGGEAGRVTQRAQLLLSRGRAAGPRCSTAHLSPSASDGKPRGRCSRLCRMRIHELARRAGIGKQGHAVRGGRHLVLDAAARGQVPLRP